MFGNTKPKVIAERVEGFTQYMQVRRELRTVMDDRSLYTLEGSRSPYEYR